MNRAWRNSIDWYLLVPSLYLLVLGLIVLGSLQVNNGFDFSSHLIGVGLGVGLALVISLYDRRIWLRLAPWLYGLSIVFLILVLAISDPVQGAKRWLDVGGILQFQPSELAKVALILLSARLLTLRKEAVNSPLSFSIMTLYALLPMLLIVLEPDLGTAIIFGFIWLALLAVSRLKRRVFYLLLLALVLVVPASSPFLADYQQERVSSFLRPAEDPLGSGYNILQSQIAIGSGGLVGKGLDSGSQSQFNFLPSAHTDFIFSVTAEKLGLIGALSVIIAFIVLILRMISIAWSSKHEFGRYVATGAAVLFSVQALVNIGMNLGLLPITGLPLPLMSFGGSHIMAEWMMIGLLMAIQK